jgi:hypothetical protein
MIIAIHQPNFIPWLGYFYKMAHCDTFVLLDDVQYTKNSFINRNRIKTSQGELWLTMPVTTSGKFGQLINETILTQKELHVKKILSTIKLNYSQAPFFQVYFGEFEQILQTPNNSLSELNIELIRWICKKLEIHTQIVKSSDLHINSELESTERLVAICQKLEAKCYLSGMGAFKYQDDAIFNTNGITLSKNKFVPPVYQQLWKEFIPSLSILDTLFNCGEQTIKYIQ